MKDYQNLKFVVRVMAEHGQVTLSGDLSDENTVIKLNREMDHVPFDQLIDDFINRYPATLEYLRGRWNWEDKLKAHRFEMTAWSGGDC